MCNEEKKSHGSGSLECDMQQIVLSFKYISLNKII